MPSNKLPGVKHMSHIHLPDGVLPNGWWLLAYIAAFIWLYAALRQAESERIKRRLPFLAAMSTLMLLTMSIPLGPLPVHLNLAVLAGIVVGPWLGFVAVFVVNTILSFLGHGGLTAVGLNSLLTGLEVVMGWWFYHRLLRSWNLSWRTLAATGAALLLTSCLAVSVVGLTSGALNFSWSTHLEGEVGVEQAVAIGSQARLFGLSGMAALAFLLLCGLIVEVIATLAITSYLQRVRPELLVEEMDV